MKELLIQAATREAEADLARFQYYIAQGDIENAKLWAEFSHSSWCKLEWLASQP